MLIDAGFSQRHVAAKLKVSRGAVQRALNRPLTQTRPGRTSRSTTHHDDIAMKRMVTRDPHLASSAISHEMGCRGVRLSSRTVRRRLSSTFGLVARRPAKLPLMTERQRLARLKFCHAHKSKNADWWHKVMFSDESTFCQVRGTGTNYVRRPRGSRYDPMYTVKTVKHPPSIMAWGAITAQGRSGLCLFDQGTRVNASAYIEVLQAKVPMHMSITNTSIFQQDSAPCHTAKVVRKWFERNNVELLQGWPSNSPDLNVIENCWAVMKQKVAAHRPKSAADLKCILREVWTQEISQEYCRKLVDSMPARIMAVIANKGYPIKY